jgi:serine/tyrosine/threonine adenylyltransferase
MNTDNTSIAGETIDYGPCAFMDSYDPATVYSSIDSVGRYAYGNQPRIARWNLARLAEALLPLLDEDKDNAVQKANEALNGFGARFEAAYVEGLRSKLGLLQAQADDLSLAQGLLDLMAKNGADFTLTFRNLGEAAASPEGDAGVRNLFTDPTAYDAWAVAWRRRLADDGTVAVHERMSVMRAANPGVIPRNHLVEEAISAAVDNNDFTPFEELIAVLARPYEDVPATLARYAVPPRPDQVVRQTFCGT